MLPDYLAPGLSVVFCGTAAGKTSASVGHYYANPGNKFLKTLHVIGLTDRILRPEEDGKCLSFGFGFTDLVKSVAGMDKAISSEAFEPNSVHAIIRHYRPRAIAFNGKKAAQVALAEKNLRYGQSQLLGQTSVWVLPSTSGAANGFWSLAPWMEMAASLR
jgi:double-stranded uracil-DNA glycosylase